MGHSYYASTLNEMEKLWRRRTTKAFLLLALLAPIVAAAALSAMQGAVAAFGAFATGLPLLMLGLFTFALLPWFASLAAAHAFTGEAADRTMKLTLVRPVTRGVVFASKATSIALLVAAALAVLWTASLAAGSLMPSGSFAGAADSAKAYAAAFAPMLAMCLIASFIAVCVSRPAAATALFLSVYAAGKLAAFVFPAVSFWSVFSYTDWYTLWVGGGAPSGQRLRAFLLLASYCIMAYTTGWFRFERRQW